MLLKRGAFFFFLIFVLISLVIKKCLQLEKKIQVKAILLRVFNTLILILSPPCDLAVSLMISTETR